MDMDVVPTLFTLASKLRGQAACAIVGLLYLQYLASYSSTNPYNSADSSRRGAV